jgi:lysophospholipase L1-like esterase
MKNRALVLGLVTVLASLPSARSEGADPFLLKDGDRVVWLGNTLIEREQRYGYWETLLTSHYSDKNITFRNLGWSGDTVFGHARAGFGSIGDGFRHLKEHVLALKPTVIFVGYGLNESFEGEAGLPKFVNGLNVLLDVLVQTRARIVFLAPLPQEDLGRPLPDPAQQNKNIRLYAAALAKAARERGCQFLDLSNSVAVGKSAGHEQLTDNGIHLTAFGYWRTAEALERGLGLKPLSWRIEVTADGQAKANGAEVTELSLSPVRFRAIDSALPLPPAPTPSLQQGAFTRYERILCIQGLARGSYMLTIDGHPIGAATAADWSAGVKLRNGPPFDQVERLRSTIIEKNLLYFHRWRPQNETYLFGFRKHEQGQNAREIPQFDPLVAKLEADIAKVRVPVSYLCELVKQSERAK